MFEHGDPCVGKRSINESGPISPRGAPSSAYELRDETFGCEQWSAANLRNGFVQSDNKVS